MPKRHYSDEEKAAALAALKANGGNIDRTAQQVGVPRNTLRRWIVHPDHAAPPHLRQQKTLDLSAKLENIANLLADAIPDKIGPATVLQCATSMAIAIDKKRVLDEKPSRVDLTTGGNPFTQILQATSEFQPDDA
jgi:hypothetical protein